MSKQFRWETKGDEVFCKEHCRFYPKCDEYKKRFREECAVKALNGFNWEVENESQRVI